MSQFRLARLALMVAALGLNATPALMHSAAAEDKAAATQDAARPELIKLIDPADVKKLLDAKNYTELQNRITQAEALPNLTPYEKYVTARTKLNLASATKNEQLLQSALETILETGKLAPADQPRFTKVLADTYVSTKQYPKAIELYKKLQASGYEKEAIDAQLARVYAASNDYGQAASMLGTQIDAQVKAGKTPAQDEIRQYAATALRAKDNAGYLHGLELLASYYPTDDYWNDLVKRGIFQKPGYSDANDLNVLRLLFAATKTMSPESYTDLADLTLNKDGFPTEAKKVLDAGFAAGALSESNAKQKQLRDKAAKQAADDAKTIAASEAAAAKAKSGAGLVNLGWAYVTMDQFDKGIGFIEQGIAKGGLKVPDEAKLRLGMAYARAGQKDKAIQTFESVKAGGGLSDIAKYWILLLNHPTAGGAGAAK